MNKKITFRISALLLISQLSFGQTPDWNMAGNSQTGGTATLGYGSGNLYNIDFVTRGNLRFKYHDGTASRNILSYVPGTDLLYMENDNFEIEGFSTATRSTASAEANTLHLNNANLLACSYGEFSFKYSSSFSSDPKEPYPFSSYHPDNAATAQIWKIPVIGNAGSALAGSDVIPANRFGKNAGKIGVMGTAMNYGQNYASIGVFGFADHIHQGTNGALGSTVCGGEFEGHLYADISRVPEGSADFHGEVYGAVGRADISDADNFISTTDDIDVIGLYGIGTGTTISSTDVGTVIGVRGEASGGEISIGGFFSTSGYPSWNSTNSTWGLYVEGNDYVSGSVYTSSDTRLKENITEIENASDMLAGISGYSYNFNNDAIDRLGVSKGQHFGVIAQEIEPLVENITTDNGQGDLAVSYDMLIPVLIQAHKEQQAEIDELKMQLEIMKTSADEVEINKGGDNNPIKSNNLAQFSVSPNPNDGNFHIQYFVLNEYQNAAIRIYDLNGKIVFDQLLEDQNGNLSGSISAFGKGSYIASLVVDGQVQEMKKMIVH